MGVDTLSTLANSRMHVLQKGQKWMGYGEV